MPITRISSPMGYRRVLSGLNLNLSRLLKSQTQLSSGLRFQKASEDPSAARRVLSLRNQLAASERAQSSLFAGETLLNEGATRLQDSSGLVAEARELMIQAMNGVLDPDSRRLIGEQIGSIRDELLRLANSDVEGSSLFAGSQTGTTPFAEQSGDRFERAVYQGDSLSQSIEVDGSKTPLTLSGLDLFAGFEPTGVSLVGSTGLQLGATANEGTGSAEIEIRTDSIDLGTLGTVGITSSGIGSDAVVGSRSVTIDAAAGTIQLGSGPAVALPDVASAEAADFQLVDENGATLDLDLSGWDGSSLTTTVSGEASIAFDGGPFEVLDTLSGDLRLSSPDGARIVHVDATAVNQAGRELVHFTGAENLFDVLAAVEADLGETTELGESTLQDRLGLRLVELDRHMRSIGGGLGTLGARSQRLGDTRDGYASIEVNTRERLSAVQDADLSEVILDLQQSQSALQLTQATGARLLQNTLIDYLR